MTPTLFNTHSSSGSILDQAGQDILRAVEQDWRKMCGNDVKQARTGLDPMRMDLALPYMFILQRTGPGAARVRVAGQKLHEMVRYDPRGMSFCTFFDETARDTAMELVEAALTLPAIIRIPLMAPRGFARTPVRAEALLLPMRDTEGDLNRVIGVIVPETPLRPKQYSWGIDPKRELMCDIQEGHFPDRRSGPRTNIVEADATCGIRLVVDNTKTRETA